MSDSDDSSNGPLGDETSIGLSTSDAESRETASPLDRSRNNETVEPISDNRRTEDIVMDNNCFNTQGNSVNSDSNCQDCDSNSCANHNQGNSINDSPMDGSGNSSIGHGTDSVSSSSASGSVESFDKLATTNSSTLEATDSPSFKTEVVTTFMRHLEIGKY